MLNRRILTRNYHLIESGIRRLYRTDHYVYDKENRLISLIEGSGHTHFKFEYSPEGNVSAFYVHDARVSFEYDELGRKSKEIYVTSTITYEYDINSLLLSKTTTGKNESVCTFKYE